LAQAGDTRTHSKPLYQALADSLRDGITSGEFADMRLPTESELCKSNGVSRITVRKALDLLSAEQLISREPGRGTFVKSGGVRVAKDLSGTVVGMNLSGGASPASFPTLQMLGASEFFEKHETHVCVKRDPPNLAEALDLFRTLSRAGVQGFLCYSNNDRNARVLAEAALKIGLPAVLLNTHLDDVPLDSLTCDNVLGGEMAAEYLIKLGHRRIAFVSVDKDVSTRDRWTGFRKAAGRHGLEPACFAGWQIDKSSALERFVAGRQDATAALCTHDVWASRLVRLLLENGVEVPEEVSVIGYDNHVEHCVNALVPLTTIAQPAKEMGARAAQLLWERINGIAPDEPRRLKLRPRLVARNSVAPPKR